jgi:hypothetical protein
MKRSQAQAAIDDAFAEGLKHLFEMLERNMIGEDKALATKQFREGIHRHGEAHSAASVEIEKIFLEN